MNDILLTRRRKVVRFTCHSVSMKPGMAGRLFSALGSEGINVIHMFNADHGENDGDIIFSVAEKHAGRTTEVLDRIRGEIEAGDITAEHDLAILSFDLEETVCDTVLDTMSVALRALISRKVDVKHISASRSRIFVVLYDRDADQAAGILTNALKDDPIIHPV